MWLGVWMFLAGSGFPFQLCCIKCCSNPTRIWGCIPECGLITSILDELGGEREFAYGCLK